MMDCVAVPYSNYANLVSSVLEAREVYLVLDMLVQRYDEFGPSDRWFSCLSTQVSFLKQHLDGVSLFVDSCKGSFVTNDGEIPDIPSEYSKSFFAALVAGRFFVFFPFLSSLSCFLSSLGIY